MSIQTGITNQCLERIATGTYNFSTDVFKVALYTSSASLGPTTTTYSSTNELSGGGYTAGGYTLTNVTPVVSERTLRITWSDVTTGSLTQSDIRGAVIYNTTVSNEVVYVVDFGRVLSKTSQTLTVKFLSTGTLLFRG
jgi:hypothetical protein